MIYFTSDHHHGHGNIVRLCDRPYHNEDKNVAAEAMTEDIIAHHNSVVRPEDIVYHLGDFSLNKKFVQPVLSRMNGVHHLVCGNHDTCHPCNKNATDFQTYIDFGFASVQTALQLRLGSTLVQLSHFPYFEEGSGQDVRYPEHRLPDEGLPLLCGHVHEKWSNRRSSKGTLMINVGVDVRHMTPIDETHILDIIGNV